MIGNHTYIYNGEYKLHEIRSITERNIDTDANDVNAVPVLMMVSLLDVFNGRIYRQPLSRQQVLKCVHNRTPRALLRASLVHPPASHTLLIDDGS